MKLRIVFGLLLLTVAAIPVVEYLFFNQGLRPEQMKAEEILLGRIWAVVSPICALAGIALLFGKLPGRTRS